MIAVFATVAHLAAAPSKKSSQPRDQPDNSAGVSTQETERNLRMIADELRAIREQTAAADRTRAAQEQQQHPRLFGNDAPVWSNWILAVIAFFAGVVATRAFNHERDAVKLTERADVAVDRIDANTLEGVGLWAGTVVTVWFQNLGRTRAQSVIYEGTLGIVGADDTGATTTSPASSIAPTALAPYDFRGALGTFIPSPAIELVNAGKLELRVTGKMTYDDIFDRHHSIDFAGAWNPDRQSFEAVKNEAS